MLTFPRFDSHSKLRTLAVLTSGGDAPGMNAAIRAIVRYGLTRGCQVYGVLRGYRGLLDNQMIQLNTSSVANLIQRGGTLLKTDRCDAFYEKKFRKIAAQNLKNRGIEGLVTIGGDGTFAAAHLMSKETGFPILGVPGTIDNDIAETEDTIGFDTAVNTAIEAIDRIRDTASSHDRIFLVEVMGHSSGFIALQVAMGGGAETVILPEKKISIPTICKTIERGIQRGKTSSIIVVAEGPKPGLSSRISEALMKYGYSSRVCILGHTQRGGDPTTHDRVLASVLGASAVGYLLAEKSNAMVGVQNDQVVLVPFTQIFRKKKKLPTSLIDLAQVLAS